MSDHPLGATVAGVLLFVIGLGIGGGTLETQRRERARMDGWQRADGTVVELLPGSPGAAPRPVIAFTTSAGDRIRFTPAGRSALRRYTAGDRVPLVYPLDQPSAAQIDPRSARWARLGVAAGASIVLMALGGYVAWYARRRVGGVRLQ